MHLPVPRKRSRLADPRRNLKAIQVDSHLLTVKSTSYMMPLKIAQEPPGRLKHQSRHTQALDVKPQRQYPPVMLQRKQDTISPSSLRNISRYPEMSVGCIQAEDRDPAGLLNASSALIRIRRGYRQS